MGERRNAYNVLVRKFEGKKPLSKPKNICEDDIRIDLRETGWEAVDWMHLAQDRDQWQALVNTVTNLQVI
jgi:hypothetical protein